MIKLSKTNFEQTTNHISHEEDGEIVEDTMHQAWILDIGDVDQKQLENLRDEIIESVENVPMFENLIKLFIRWNEHEVPDEYFAQHAAVLLGQLYIECSKQAKADDENATS